MPKENNNRIFKLPRNVFFLGIVSMFSDIGTEMIYPLIPIFLKTTLHAGFPFIGLVEGVAESTASLFKVFSGWLSDKVKKRKPLIVAGYSLSAFSKPFLSIAAHWSEVLFIRFIDRSGKGIREAPRDAMIADSSNKNEIGRSFGFHRSFDTAGAVIGPLLTLLLLGFVTNNLRIIFLLAIIPGVLSVAFLKPVKELKRRKTDGKLPKLSLKQFDLRFKIFLFIIVIFSLGNPSDVFLILRADNLGIKIALVPGVYLVSNIVYVIFSGPAGILADKYGHKRLITTGFFIYSLVYLGFALAKSSPMVWFLFAFYGLYYALTDGVIRAFTADIVPRELIGIAYGILFTFIGISLLPASLIAGFLFQNVSPSAPFYLGSITSFISVVLILVVYGVLGVGKT